MFVVNGKRRYDQETQVWLNKKELPLHLDICNHSPTGFNWGYRGSGPAQLAFCIVYEYLIRVYHLDENEAVEKTYSCHTEFKDRYLASIGKDEFEYTEADLRPFFVVKFGYPVIN